MVRLEEINNTYSESVKSTWLLLCVNSIDKRQRILAIVFNAILMLVTIFLNLLSVTTIRKSSQLKNKICYFVIQVQSVVDFVVGFLGMPLFVVFLAAPLLAIQNCLVLVILLQPLLLSATLSTVTLSGMTLERYIAVLHPYSYKKLVTKRRILMYVSVFSLIELGTTISTIFTLTVVEYYVAITIAVHFSFTVFVYTRIYRVVRKLDRGQQRPVDVAQNHNVRKRFLREIKHAKTCFVAVLCFAICFLPSAAGSFVLANENVEFNAKYFNWALTVYALNSSLNSIIFFWKNALLRKEAYVILTPFGHGCIRAFSCMQKRKSSEH